MLKTCKVRTIWCSTLTFQKQVLAAYIRRAAISNKTGNVRIT